ncbi:tetratricopeptide repeat protein [Enterovibrio makurazakiensis]|uniref:Ancillary SecYEG translocon subunit n=1 Tax=Enterovibrio gelatinilyticus TaxID=2899819 RepID=A0ABT5QYV0_9GAMM|nr:tetratricopeptide repeat protein [Enterovibrio sp. ZSDZ42]MDD1792716.1 tetratricopeptide repeat protein [Enterovibrio sp. ZSDZ42]
MDVYTTEEQQVEAIKTWWRDNGKAIILGAVIGLGGLYGWRYYQSEQETSREQASEAYMQVVGALAAGDADAQEKAAAFIQSNDSSYSALVELQLAKTFVEAGDLVKAAEHLRSVQASKDDSLKATATLRLARVEAQQGNVDAALKELDSVTAESWKPQVEELRGDIQLRKGDTAAARLSYAASIAAASNPVVQMKLDNLPQ